MSSTNPVQRTKTLSGQSQKAEGGGKAVRRPRTKVSEARSGAKATVVQAKDRGQKRDASLGPYPGTYSQSCVDSRKKALDALAGVKAGTKSWGDAFDQLDQFAQASKGIVGTKAAVVQAKDLGQKSDVSLMPYPGERSDHLAANSKNVLTKFKGVNTKGDLASWGNAFDLVGKEVLAKPKPDVAKSSGLQDIPSAQAIPKLDLVKTRKRSEKPASQPKAFTAKQKLENGGLVVTFTRGDTTFSDEAFISEFPAEYCNGVLKGLTFKDSILKTAKGNLAKLDYRAGKDFIRIGTQCLGDINRINLTVYGENDKVLYQSKEGGSSDPTPEIQAALKAIKKLTKDTNTAEVVAAFVGDQQFPSRAFGCLSAAVKELQNFKPSGAGAKTTFGHALVKTNDGSLAKVSGDEFGGGARIPVSLRRLPDGDYRVDISGSPAVMVADRANEGSAQEGIEGRVVHMNCHYTIKGDQAAQLEANIKNSKVQVGARVEGPLSHVKRINKLLAGQARQLKANAEKKGLTLGSRSRPASPRQISPTSPSGSSSSSSPVASPVSSPTHSPRGKSTAKSPRGLLRRHGSRPGSPRQVLPASPSTSSTSSSPVASPVTSPTNSPRDESTGGSTLGSPRRKK